MRMPMLLSRVTGLVVATAVSPTAIHSNPQGSVSVDCFGARVEARRIGTAILFL